ncbi:hypothetical protein BG005_002532 [Podila minutissima]|nr:hypothetical protein BG005_002532 [Podila minutissima]
MGSLDEKYCREFMARMASPDLAVMTSNGQVLGGWMNQDQDQDQDKVDNKDAQEQKFTAKL